MYVSQVQVQIPVHDHAQGIPSLAADAAVESGVDRPEIRAGDT